MSHESGGQPQIPHPDRIEPQAPPETPPSPRPDEAPPGQPDEFQPVQPDVANPGSIPDEAPMG